MATYTAHSLIVLHEAQAAAAVTTLPPGLNGALQQYDYDSPAYLRAYQRRITRSREDYSSQPSARLNLLIGQDTFYGEAGQTSWGQMLEPLPLKRQWPIEIRTWEKDSLNNVLLGQDIVYGDPGQAYVFATDPNPLRRRPLHQDHVVVSPNTNILAALEDIPPGLGTVLYKYDYDTAALITFRLRNERSLRSGRAASEVFQDASLTNLLIGQDIFYGEAGQSPWGIMTDPLRREYKRGIDLRTWVEDLINHTLAGQDTFYGAPGQTAWGIEADPNPLLRQRGVDLRTWIKNYETIVPVPLEDPRRPSDWTQFGSQITIQAKRRPLPIALYQYYDVNYPKLIRLKIVYLDGKRIVTIYLEGRR